MKVTVINPNSSRAVTRTITTVARAAAEQGIDLIIAENRRAPLSIEGFTDGIEAVMNAAVMISSRFSIVTAMQRSVPILEDNARRSGVLNRCRGIHAFDQPVLSFGEADIEDYYSDLLDRASTVVRDDC